MAVALATLPLGAAAGEVYACPAGDAAGLAACLAVDDLAAAGWAALATGLTIYGAGAACGLALRVTGLGAATGLADAAALADPPLFDLAEPALLARATGFAAAALPLLVVLPVSGLTGDLATSFFALVFGNGFVVLFFAMALVGAGFADGLEATRFGATFFGAAFAGVIFLLTAAFELRSLSVAVLVDAVFFFAAEAAGFFATAAFPATGFLATGFLAAAFLPVAGLVAALDGLAALRTGVFFATGLLATGLAADRGAVAPLARVVAAATAALLGLPAAFPFCAFAAVELCVVFAISLHRYGRCGRVL